MAGIVIEDLEPLENPRQGNAGRHSRRDIPAQHHGNCAVRHPLRRRDARGHGPLGRSKREFLESFLPLRNGIPGRDTFSGVFRLPDPEAFQRWFPGFMRQLAQGCAGVLAVDGKTNEMTAVPRLLEMLTLPGMAVTAGAMRCQRQLSQQLLDQGAGYALALKGNQESLNGGVRLFPGGRDTPVAEASQANQGHGRIGTRTAGVSGEVAWLHERHRWPSLAAAGKITASRQAGNRISVESRYCLLSQAYTPERFNCIAREHWGTGNRLHWVLDVMHNEDQSRNRKDNGADNLALLRKLALNLARLEPTKVPMRGKLKRAGWDHDYLITMLSQFTKYPNAIALRRATASKIGKSISPNFVYIRVRGVNRLSGL